MRNAACFWTSRGMPDWKPFISKRYRGATTKEGVRKRTLYVLLMTHFPPGGAARLSFIRSSYHQRIVVVQLTKYFHAFIC